MKKIKNATTTSKTWCGQTIEPNEYYTIQEIEYGAWASNSALLTAIANGEAVINDGTSDINDVNRAINFLKDINITNEIGATVIDLSPRLGSSNFEALDIVSHDFTDATTWYQNAAKVTDEVLTTTDYLTYSSINPTWINIDNIKLSYEHNTLLLSDGSYAHEEDYRVVVKKNSNIITEGFSIDYVLGKITFTTQQSSQDIITATYYHVNNVTNASQFIVRPSSGTIYYVNHLEVQVSQNISFTNKIYFEAWGGGSSYSDYGTYSDETFDLGYGVTRNVFKGMRDLFNWCNNQYPTFPACGDLQYGVIVFPFFFSDRKARILSSQPNISSLIRIYLRNHTALSGELGTITFYMIKENL